MTDVHQSRYGFVVMILITWLATQPVSVHCLDNGVVCRLACSIWRVFHDTFVKSNDVDIVYDNCLRTCERFQPGQEKSTPPLPTVSTTTTTKTTTPQPTTTTSPSITRKFCGLQARNSAKIVGGVLADKCEFPWLVRVSMRISKTFCGGSLVDRRHVITAAHCVKDKSTGNIFSPNDVSVGYGSSVRVYQDTVNVTRVLPHPLFNKTNFDYDVAVLTLAIDLVYDECVSPICLPDVDSDPKEADKCTAAGWGRIRFNRHGSQSVLRKVDLPIVDQTICSSNRNERIEYINDLKLCAGDFQEGGIATCFGDSGGPLMCQTEGVFYLHGITSFTRGCALPRYPGVFTRVTHPEILDFIREGINDIPRDS